MPTCMQTVTAQELAERFDMVLKGKPDRKITGIQTLARATSGDLSFLTNAVYLPALKQTQAGIVILRPDDLEHCPTDALVSENPRLVYAAIASWLFAPKETTLTGIHPTAVVAPNAEIHETAYIGPNCTVGEGVKIGASVCLMASVDVGAAVTIGQGSFIYPSVTLYSDTHIGEHCRIHSGTVLGSDGFGFEPDAKGHWHKVPQIGGVRIGNRVEIGANCTIDRGAVDDTTVEDGVILDNLIQVAHNVQIGSHSAIAGCTGISGSTTIGRHCLIGGGTCIKGHITIADGVQISGMSMVTRSIHRPGVYSSGIPVKEKAVWLKNATRFHQLDDIARRLKSLESKVKERS